MSTTYTVVKGDCLSRIAQRHGITLSELLAANPQFTSNGRDPDLIYPGEQVVIPDSSEFDNTSDLENGTTECPNCTPGSVTLSREKSPLTLKHDRDCRLDVDIDPPDVCAESFRIEIRRDSGADWCMLHGMSVQPGTALSYDWQATIAGQFKLRAVVTICGTEHTTPEVDVEVRFPSYAEIAADPDVVTATDAEWQSTLADCTEHPNQRRERGFWIRLNTTSNSYEHAATVTGSFRRPNQGASVPLPARPADTPATPSPCDAGAVYSVASFHTHTPTEFRAAASPPGATRGVGPSGADRRIDTRDDVPGLVYDYVESPAGSGSIPMGHPEGSAAQLYHSRGRDRRTTPP